MNILQSIHNSRTTKAVAAFLAVLMLDPITGLNSLLANAGGPTQPEYSKYTAVSANDLVDPFTGNVGYSVPLFEIGGYPVTMSYSGDINPEQDAGWVGLGWGLNMGSINRALRGVPDDFKGDAIKTTEKKKNNVRLNVNLKKLKSELTVLKNEKIDGVNYVQAMRKVRSMNMGIEWDSYTGLGFTYGRNQGEGNDIFHIAHKDSTIYNETSYIAEEASDISPAKVLSMVSAAVQRTILDQCKEEGTKMPINISYNTKRGFDFSKSIYEDNKLHGILKGVGFIPTTSSFNSRSGRASLGLDIGVSNNSLNASYTPNLLFVPTFHAPPSDFVSRDFQVAVDFSSPTAAQSSRRFSVIVDVSVSKLRHNKEEFSREAYGTLYMGNGNDYPNEEGKSNVITDVQEHGAQIDRYSKEMSTVSVNHDIFNISAAGVGGSFRLNQNKLLMYGPGTFKQSPSITGISLKGEFGSSGATSELGADVGVNLVRKKYESLGKNDFKNQSIPSWFNYGEGEIGSAWQAQTMRNDFEFIENQKEYSDGFQGTEAIYFNPGPRLKLAKRFENQFKTLSGETIQLTGAISKSNRDARQQVVSYMTAEEASTKSFQPQIENYISNDGQPVVVYQNGVFTPAKVTINRYGSSNNDGQEYRQKHHISEITVLQPDGTRYYFGTPVYNTSQDEYVFNTAQELYPLQGGGNNSPNIYDFNNSTTNFSPADIGTENKKGTDEYSNHRNISAYSSTYLLNSVLSSDYVDKTNDGLTEDDLGNYVKFNYWQSTYKKANSESSNWEYKPFKWRSSFGNADLNINNRSDQFDDKGSFTFGNKEMWYIHSIETKDQIALFYLAKRLDGIEANSIYGGKNNGANPNYQYYLEKVVLYSKAEFNKLGTSATPLKTVHLEYAYDLCKGFPYTVAGNTLNKKHPLTGNVVDYNQGGKLTLYKIWFTYGNLQLPTTAPFVFNYAGYNPRYSYKSVDRWGTFVDSTVVNPGLGYISKKTNIDYPYTRQNDKTNADNWSSAWLLTDIILPSGGKIHIDYESDDYAYVQDRQAMEMVKVEAFSDRADLTPLTGLPNELYTTADKFNFNVAALDEQKVKDLFKPSRQYAIVKLKDNTSISDYCSVGDMLYYNTCVSLDKNNLRQADYEPINGYAEVSEIGNLTNNYAYIKFKHENAGPWPVNMMFRMAMQQGLNKAPHLFYPNSDLRRAPLNATDFVGLALGSVKEAIQMVATKVKYFQNANMCRYVDLNRSFLRLNSASKKKLGGGHRVKQVSISDEWNVISGGDEKGATYKIKYEYTTTENGVEISSGVASYEPFTGGDENPFRMPKDIKPKGVDKLLGKSPSKVGKEFRGLGPQQLSFDLDPVGEEFYPSAIVGYSRVKISTVYPTKSNPNQDQVIDKHKTGYTVTEFYTAKDFPSYSERTTLERRQTNIKGPKFQNILGAVKFTDEEKKKMRDYYDIPAEYRSQQQNDFLNSMKQKQEDKEKDKTKWGFDLSVQLQYTLASQGFKIVTNDMHGKLKSNLVFTEDMTTPFSGSYYHYKVDDYGNLTNNIDVVRKSGQIESAVAGLQIEPIIFGSQITETNHNIRPKVDVEVKSPLVIPLVSLGYGLNRKTSKFITITKHIRQSGLIDYVQVFDKGATTTTKNLAWDALTGQVLITSITNEHNDVVYNLTKPAHWMYEALNGAFTNMDYKVNLSINNGKATVSNNLLVPGDELIHRFDEEDYALKADATKYWVLSVVGNEVYLIDKLGQVIPNGDYRFKVIRSGRRNILGIGAETITMVKEPWAVNNNVKTIKVDPNAVIVGKGLTYSDDRQVFEKKRNCWSFQCDETEMGTQPISNDPVFPFKPKQSTFNTINCTGAPSNFIDIFNSGNYITIGSDGYALDEIVNPFNTGIMGVWKPFGDYIYYDKRNGKELRTQAQNAGSYDANATNIRKDGLLVDYQEFWNWNGTTWNARTQQDTANPWNLSEVLQYVDDKGNAWQSKNVLNIHSSAIYGYGDRKLVTANSVNAQTNEILFDGFEEFDTEDNINVYCNNGQLTPFEWSSFTSYINRFSKNVYQWPISKLLIGNANQIVLTESHTGWKSLRLGPGSNMLNLSNTQSTLGNLLPNQYRLTNADFISKFAPKYKAAGDNEYVISYWVKENIPNQFNINIYQVGTTTPLSLTPTESSITVDGWKKVSLKFSITSDVEKLEIINDPGVLGSGTITLDKCCYLDDLRIHPFKSSFVSYVYDYRNYRLMATLDDNNFASFLEYDEEGALVRKKVETERGIMTVQENRNSSRR